LSIRQSTLIDALLVVMSLIWGSNFSIVKSAFREVPPQAFNAVRLVVASLIFLVLIIVARRVRVPSASAEATAGPRRPASAKATAVRRSVSEGGSPRSEGGSVFYTPAPITPGDWLRLAGLGVVGHFIYQMCFIGGLARTSVANSSLILGATPVAIALASALLGRERIGRWHWIGAAISAAGIYFVVGRGAALSAQSMTGDLLMLGAVACWTAYTLGTGRLMERHSPLGVTGFSMAIGTALYVPVMWPEIARVDWTAVSAATWMKLMYSSVFALCVAYMIWYAAVQRIGSARTSVYSNVVPIVAMAVAAAWLGEPLDATKIAGAALVLAGVALTRTGAGPYGPAEE
jgi:drug/metabolite transporter (DMT)-like permease